MHLVEQAVEVAEDLVDIATPDVPVIETALAAGTVPALSVTAQLAAAAAAVGSPYDRPSNAPC